MSLDGDSPVDGMRLLQGEDSVDGQDQQSHEHSYEKSKNYWENVQPTVDGMLGGFSRISSVDGQASARFLKSLGFEPLPVGEGYSTRLIPLEYDSNNKVKRRRTQELSSNLVEGDSKVELCTTLATTNDSCSLERGHEARTRVLDCGAGIGRVTKTVLLNFFETVDLLEQSQTFLDKAKEYISAEMFNTRIGMVYCAGLQEFEPDRSIKYDAIWLQWVTGYLTDEDLVEFLLKCKSILKQPDGMIIIKDNHTSTGKRDPDMSDSSVTRPYWQFIETFKRAGLELVKEVKQTRFPKGLYPVKMYALRVE